MKALFDWEFRTFITPKLIRIAFILAVAFGAVATVVADAAIIRHLDEELALPWQHPSNTESLLFGAVCLSPIIYLLAIVAVRVMLEATMVFFAIAESLTGRR